MSRASNIWEGNIRRIFRILFIILPFGVFLAQLSFSQVSKPIIRHEGTSTISNFKIDEEQTDESDKQLSAFVERFKGLSLQGDFRFRGEQDWDSRNTDGTYRDDRSRMRYRLRLGFTYKWSKQISFGARIRTGVPSNLQSPHINLGYNESSSLPINLDKAYISGRHNNFWWWAGKNSLPFWKQNELFWDDDVIPSGLALGCTIRINKLKLKPKVAYFIANTINNSNGGIDGTILAGQLEAKTNYRKLGITLAGAYYHMDNMNNVPITDNLYSGTRYKLNYKFLVSSVKIEMKTKKPIAIGFDYFVNLEDYSADTLMNDVFKDQKTAFIASLQIGQLKDKGDWLFGYYYTMKEELSVVSYYTEDDWVRWGNINRNRNTNYSGHEIRLAYAFGPKFNVVARVYSVEGLVSTKTHTESGNRVRLDFNIKF